MRAGGILVRLGLVLVCLLTQACDPVEKSGVDTTRELFAEVESEATWLKVARLGVEGVAEKEAVVRVSVKRAEERCEISTKSEVFKKDSPWNPLPLNVFTPKLGEEKLDSTFEKALSFDGKVIEAQSVRFLAKFVRGEFSWGALWSIEAGPVDAKAGKECRAVAYLCPNYGTKEVDEKPSYYCKGEWKWLKQVLAIPDRLAYFTGIGKDVTGIRGEYFYRDKQGNIKEYSETY